MSNLTQEPVELHQLLREALIVNNISVGQFADSINRPQSTVEAWISAGLKLPRRRYLDDISKSLNIPFVTLWNSWWFTKELKGDRRGGDHGHPAVCGSSGGINAHRRRNEKPCRECLNYKNEYDKQWRREQRHKQGLPLVHRAKCGTYGGWQKHQMWGTLKCQPCKDAYNTYMRERRKVRNALAVKLKELQD